MINSLKYAHDRESWYEYFGKIIPGFAGIIFLISIWSSSVGIKIILGILGIITIIMGRAFYEMIVFEVLKIKNK